MEPGAPFDLSAHVAQWRWRLTARYAFAPDDLDELEAHLWEIAEARIRSGHSERVFK